MSDTFSVNSCLPAVKLNVLQMLIDGASAQAFFFFKKQTTAPRSRSRVSLVASLL